MAVLKGLDGTKKIKENYQNLPDDIAAVNTQVVDHVAGNADKHNSSDVVNDSGVSGADQAAVNNNLEADRLAGDAALQSQIDTLVVGGTVDPLTDVYKAKDLVNTNDYVITYGSIIPFEGMRFNVEVANSNTGASTVDLNSNGPKPVYYLREGVTYPVIGGMITGITELQYSVTHDGYIILTKEVPVVSDPIITEESVHQLGGATYKSMDFDGAGDTVMNGNSAVQLVENGDFSNGVGSWENTASSFSVTDGIGELLANAIGGRIYKDHTIRNGKSYFVASRYKATSSLVSLAFPGGATIASHSGNGQYETVYAKYNATSDETSNLQFVRDTRSSSWDTVYIDWCMCIELSDADKLLSADQLASKYSGYLETGLNHANGTVTVTGKNLSKSQFELGDIIGATGQDQPNSTRIRTKGFDRVLPSTQVTYSFPTSLGIVLKYEYDINENYISGSELGVSAGNTKFTFTTNQNTYKIRFLFRDDTNTDKDTQLEIGTVATDYQAYLDQQVTVSEFKDLPNGEADSYDLQTGIETRVVGENAIQDADISLATTFVNVDAYYVQLPANSFDGNTSTIINGTTLLGNGSREISVNDADNINQIGNYYLGDNRLRYIVAKGQSLIDTQNELRDTIILYQLATPVTIQSEAKQINYQTGGIMYTDSAIAPEVEYTVNLNGKAALDSTIRALVRVENESDEKYAEINGKLTGSYFMDLDVYHGNVKTVDDGQDVSPWTLTPTADTADKKVGDQSVAWTITGTQSVTYDNLPATDLTKLSNGEDFQDGKDYITLMIKPATGVTSVLFRLSSDATFGANYVEYDLNFTANQWNLLKLKKGDFTVNGTGITWSNVQSIQFSVATGGSADFNYQYIQAVKADPDGAYPNPLQKNGISDFSLISAQDFTVINEDQKPVLKLFGATVSNNYRTLKQKTAYEDFTYAVTGSRNSPSYVHMVEWNIDDNNTILTYVANDRLYLKSTVATVAENDINRTFNVSNNDKTLIVLEKAGANVIAKAVNLVTGESAELTIKTALEGEGNLVLYTLGTNDIPIYTISATELTHAYHAAVADIALTTVDKNIYEWELIDEYTLTGAIDEFSFTDIPADYKHLKIEGRLSINEANGGAIGLVFNDDNASSNYQHNGFYQANATDLYESSLSSNFITLRAGISYSGHMSKFKAEIDNTVGEYKTCIAEGMCMDDAATFQSSTKYASWNNTASLINKITLDLVNNTNKGVVRLYGKK